MDQTSLLFLVAGLSAGFVLGVIASLVYNKFKTGSVSANKLNQEKKQYQADVEAHFEETSRQFKAMTEQYQEFYQHLSKGATTLCSAEAQSKLLIEPSLTANEKLVDASPKDSKKVEVKAKPEREPSIEASAKAKKSASVEPKHTLEGFGEGSSKNPKKKRPSA